jgi:DNA-binding beta-propeller fold protein YncE
MLALIYLGVAICVGDRLCCQFYRYVSIAHRWATAVLVGLLLSTCFTYLAGRHFASASNPLLWGDLLFFATAAIFLLTCPPKRDGLFIIPPTPRSAKWDWITLGIYCALATWMMFATLDFKNGNVLIGTNQWSDYGPNTAIVQSFAFGHNFPAEYPHFANEPIRYHFLFYFLAGNLEFLGLNLAWSLNIISILTMVCMLAVVIALGELLFKSRAVGIVASVFFFFHGTLSLIPFLRSQTSFKGALLSASKLVSYLSSGYPYRGEDWGIWTQVVFVNQRHFASSIGIFLVVLFFLFDRYLERAKQRKLDRALAAGVGPLPGDTTLEPPISGETSTGHARGEQAREVGLVDEARIAADFQPSEQWPPTPSSKSSGETEASSGLESIDEGTQATSSAQASEAEGLTRDLGDEPSPQASEISSISEAEPSDPIISHAESSQAGNYAAGETRTSDVVPDNEGPEISSGSAPPPSDPEESFDKPSVAASQPSETEPSTFSSRAYDEYMGLGPGPGSASEAQAFEAREEVIQTSQDPDRSPIPAAAGVTVPLVTIPEPVPRASRGVILDFVYDNLVNGKGFLFSGLLLGALPYWNAPVFTAAAAVLAFLFVLFPCRRYMVGLAITAAVVGLPQVLALRSGNARAGTHLIHWGYTLGAVPVSQVLKYLWWTFGIKWILIFIGLLFSSWHHLRLFVAIFSLFLLTFCLQFSDEALANHKFLNIWLVIANLFVAYGLWRLWRLRIKGWAIPSRLVAVVLASPIIAGGIIDFFPIHNATFIVTGYTKDRLIDWIRAETKPDAVFLSDKFVNHPILLAGRRIFYGYTYFTWGAGYDLPKREAQYVKMFESKNPHQVFTLLKANGIDYVAFDAGIRGHFKNSNEQQVYAPNFKKVFEGAPYWNLTIYQVPENADFVPATLDPGAVAAAATTGVGAFEGGKGKENGQFDFPRGVAVDSAGNIFVADTNNGRLQKFSPTGVFLKVIGKMGDGPGEFREPSGIAIDAANNIYVADVANHRVQKLKPDGTFLAQWKGPEPGLYGPRDIAVGSDNSVYVSDQGHSRIIKLDPNGKALAVWGTPGSGDGQFTDATSVAVDGKNNRVYVADPRNKRIQVFDANGKYLTKWAVEEWIPSGWYFQDLVVDPVAERLYASAVATDEVLVFDFTGKKIASLKPNPPDRLEGASSLALVKGKLYVVNTYASHLSWIALPDK